MGEQDFQSAQHDLGFLHEQWNGLCAPYGASSSVIESLFQTIVEHYSERARAYHTLSHIQSLLSMGESLKEKFQSYDVVRFAIWFHDVIYDTKRSDNEEKSAELAAGALARVGVPSQTREAVQELILATKHHRGADLSWDAKAFLDMDTSILGASDEVYKEYSRAIRKEYSWVLGILYRRGRKKVLNDFLARERIYLTEEIGIRCEMQARHNIEEEIRTLSR